MAKAKHTAKHTIGWIGTGRMGFQLATRLLEAGHKVAVYNRTRAKAEPLTKLGATLVDSPAALADRDIVFTIVGQDPDFIAVTTGPGGVLTRKDTAPKILIDVSTVSDDVSLGVRAAAAKRGCDLLAAPISGNPKVVKAGKGSVVVSGPAKAFATARPYLATFGRGVSYVGDKEQARLVKICHNVMLGVVAECLAEISVLATAHGIPRHAFLDFFNNSVMGSEFTRYKSPAYVNLDFAATFTPPLLRKDLELGLTAARKRDVPMPVTALVREILTTMIGNGYKDQDFATFIMFLAKGAGLKLKPENVAVDDGLSAADAKKGRAKRA
ncbi:MAG TPA: NAD(P)-dependent oxidoreductase [Candidatus Sulfotelmatobacter sp.]|nr:NAD(P)-dependent oxidoreductase [Candidatus Sulfotelmatobacter sp.]